MTGIKVPIAAQVAEVGREVGLRKNVYPSMVFTGKMTEAQSHERQMNMEAAYRTLKWVQAHEADLKLFMERIG